MALEIQGDKKESLAGRIALVAEAVGGIPTLARVTGYSDSGIRKWVQGQAEPTASKLVRLAEAGGFTVEWLATGNGEPHEQSKPQETARGPARKGVEAAFIRSAVKIAERRLEQHLDLDTKARIIADIAQDLQEMHDNEWGQDDGPQHQK